MTGEFLIFLAVGIIASDLLTAILGYYTGTPQKNAQAAKRKGNTNQ